MNPFFTVIIPTFNRAYSLERAIESVLNQDYKDFEIIVVDDGSTDETQEILSKFKNIIKNYRIENSGVSAARNYAVKKAQGQWLAFLDSDDEWMPYKLKLQKQFIEQNPTLRCVHGEEVWIRNGVRVNQMNKHKKGGGDQFFPSLKLCLISPSCVVLKKDLFLELGSFREDYPACEDYDLWLKLTSLYEVGFIEEPLIYKYGGHDDQLSQKFVAMDYWRIKSINWIIEHRNLSEDKLEQAKKILTKKARILLKGYKKHNNLDNYNEIEEIYNLHLVS